VPADRVDVGTLSLQPISLPELPHDLLRRVSLPLQLSHLLARSGDRDSHNGWTTFKGSRQIVFLHPTPGAEQALLERFVRRPQAAVEAHRGLACKPRYPQLGAVLAPRGTRGVIEWDWPHP